MTSGHIQVAPDSTGKNMDADVLTSDEAGNPVVYREDVVIADAKTYANKAVVDIGGSLLMRDETGLQMLHAILVELRRMNWALMELADVNAEENDIDLEYT